jgi:uncharacterized repeat protein (TIGR04076 family)
MIACKITVLKTSLNKDFVDQYVAVERKKSFGPCEVFKEGQEFIVNPWSGLPQGFCPWAWDDIYKAIVGFGSGGDFGMWYDDKNVLIACCTDGTRPVYFKIEKIEN